MDETIEDFDTLEEYYQYQELFEDISKTQHFS
jgi:hypothetical protein